MNNRVDVRCPHCGSRQTEPVTATSTFCRYCDGRFRIVASASSRDGRTTRAISGSRARLGTSPAEGAGREAERPARLGAILHSARLREVACFECGGTVEVVRSDPATICPHCAAPIELADFDIRERLARRIRTRGNVMIHRTGGLVAGTVQCHHLTVYGEISARIEATGVLSFQHSTRAHDGVRCGRLVVGSECLVEFDAPAETESAEIEGHVRGEIHCTGPVRIAPRGVAEGRITARTLTVDPGGTLLAEVELTRPPVDADADEPAPKPNSGDADGPGDGR